MNILYVILYNFYNNSKMYVFKNLSYNCQIFTVCIVALSDSRYVSSYPSVIQIVQTTPLH